MRGLSFFTRKSVRISLIIFYHTHAPNTRRLSLFSLHHNTQVHVLCDTRSLLLLFLFPPHLPPPPGPFIRSNKINVHTPKHTHHNKKIFNFFCHWISNTFKVNSFISKTFYLQLIRKIYENQKSKKKKELLL